MLINRFPLMIKTHQDLNEQCDHTRISSDFKATLTRDILRCCSYCWLISKWVLSLLIREPVDPNKYASFVNKQ